MPSPSSADGRLRRGLSSDTGKAAGMGAAAMAANVISLAFTVVFARILGEGGYGSLIALVAAFLVLAIPGQALQIAVAREVSREIDGHDPALAANVRGWTRSLLLVTAGAALVAIPAREPLAALLGVELEWAAAAVVPMAGVWQLLCIQRGVLQGVGSYRVVGGSLIGEALGRLAFGLVLVAAGLGPTGAFIGHGAALAVTCVILARPLHRRLIDLGAAGERLARRSLGQLVREAGVPLVALGLFALLQNLDVLIVRSQASDRVASDYAAVSVSAKAVIWVAIGLGLFLLPEAARRAEQGLDGRPVLARTLGLAQGVGLVAVIIFALFGATVLRLAFGEDLAQGADALPWLTVGMSLLAGVYLAVQFLLALRRWGFLALMLAAVAAEASALVAVGPRLTEVAIAVACVDGALLLALGATALRIGDPRRLRRGQAQPAQIAVETPAP